MDKTTGERLRRMRGKRRAEEVARACGISASTLYNYENNTRTPRDDVKKRIASYYGKSVKFLFYDLT